MNDNYKIPDTNFERTESYLMQKMTNEEHQVFEKELTTNGQLYNYVQETRLLILGIKENGLRNNIDSWHKVFANNKPAKKVNLSLPRWLAAAAIITVIGLGAWFVFFNKNQHERLFAQFYKPDTGLVTAMSTTDQYEFDRAMLNYKTGNYDKALQAWQTLLLSKPGSDTLHYFIASSYLATGNEAKALASFKKVEENSNSYFLKDTYWYIGLLLVKEGREAEAKSYLQKSNHWQKDKLIESLKK